MTLRVLHVLDHSIPLADDLTGTGSVVTWNSGAALKALKLGVAVWYEFPQWIGARAARPLAEWGAEPKRDDADRLAMFRRLAWAIRRPLTKAGNAPRPGSS